MRLLELGTVLKCAVYVFLNLKSDSSETCSVRRHIKVVCMTSLYTLLLVESEFAFLLFGQSKLGRQEVRNHVGDFRSRVGHASVLDDGL